MITSDDTFTVDTGAPDSDPADDIAWYVWDITASGATFPATIYAEGIATGPGEVYWRLREVPSGEAENPPTDDSEFVSRDTITISVEQQAWPNQDPTSLAAWDQTKPTAQWDAFMLAPGWTIEHKSLYDLISMNKSSASASSFGALRTEYPSLQSNGQWEGEGDTNSILRLGADWDGSTRVIEVTYAFEDAPSGRAKGHYQETIHSSSDRWQPSFFANSGVKIDGLTEIQIFDTGSLLAAMNGSSTNEAIIDGVGKDVQKVGTGINSGGFVALKHDSTNWKADLDPDLVSNLITGLPYNTGAVPNTMASLNAAPTGGGTMVIQVSRAAATVGFDYTFVVTVGGATNTYVVNKSGPRSSEVRLQSHWDSGVRFTGVKVGTGSP